MTAEGSGKTIDDEAKHIDHIQPVQDIIVKQ